MAKLIYKTKNPKHGGIMYHSECTHIGEGDIPNQSSANLLVSDAMRTLISNLDELGYDMTKVKFSIETK